MDLLESSPITAASKDDTEATIAFSMRSSFVWWLVDWRDWAADPSIAPVALI